MNCIGFCGDSLTREVRESVMNNKSKRFPPEFRERAAHMALGYDVPDLFLASMVIADGKGHQLFQIHAVLLIDIQQLVGHGHERRRCLTTLAKRIV